VGESTAWARALEAHRARRCWSVQTLSRKMRREADRVGEGVARDLGRMIRYWERGDRRPSELYRRLLSRVYGVSESELFSDAVLLDSGEVDEVRRREFLRTAAAAGVAATAPVLTPRRVGRRDVADLQRAISDARALDQRLGGDGLHHLAALQVRHARELLDVGSYADEVGRVLHATLGEACILAGWLAFDAFRHDVARGYYAEAVTAAQVAGDELVTAHVFANMSMQALQRDRPREAVMLAQTAQRCAARRGGPRLRALAAMREARGWARLGDRGAAEATIGRAVDAFEGPQCGCDPAWVAFFDEAEVAGAAGHCYVELGACRTGLARLRESARGDDGLRSRNRASWSLALADGLARCGDVAQACSVAGGTLTLLGELSSVRVRRQLRDVAARVAPHATMAEVREFRKQLATVSITA
jgi:transcriptional regulator with XRE-family HTH domain